MWLMWSLRPEFSTLWPFEFLLPPFRVYGISATNGSVPGRCLDTSLLPASPPWSPSCQRFPAPWIQSWEKFLADSGDHSPHYGPRLTHTHWSSVLSCVRSAAHSIWPTSYRRCEQDHWFPIAYYFCFNIVLLQRENGVDTDA